RHEPSDISERFIWWAVASMAALLLACASLTLWFYPQWRLDRTLDLPLADYPAPRLQPHPTADMQAFYSQEMQRLNTRSWDPAHRVGHVPIEDAMSAVVREGIPGWPAVPGAEPSAIAAVP